MVRRSIDVYMPNGKRRLIHEFAEKYFKGNLSKAVNYLIDKGLLYIKENENKLNPELQSILEEMEIKERQKDLGRAFGTKVWERFQQKLKEIESAKESGKITEEEAERLKRQIEEDYKKEIDIILKKHGIRKKREILSSEEKTKRAREIFIERMSEKHGLTKEEVETVMEYAKEEKLSFKQALKQLKELWYSEDY